MINYNKPLKNLRGEEFPRPWQFLTRGEIDKLPKKDNPENPKGPKIPDETKTGKETISNVIINCLAVHQCENKKEGFYVNMIAEHIINPHGELKDKLKIFLIEILEDSIMRKEKSKDKDGKEVETQKGIYAGWIICQCLKELGVDVED